MNAEHPQPSLADLLSAVADELGTSGANRVYRAACRARWKRLIAANQAATVVEIAGLRNAHGPAYIAAQKRIDALFAERKRMQDAAYGPMPEIEARP